MHLRSFCNGRQSALPSARQISQLTTDEQDAVIRVDLSTNSREVVIGKYIRLVWAAKALRSICRNGSSPVSVRTRDPVRSLLQERLFSSLSLLTLGRIVLTPRELRVLHCPGNFREPQRVKEVRPLKPIARNSVFHLTAAGRFIHQIHRRGSQSVRFDWVPLVIHIRLHIKTVAA